MFAQQRAVLGTGALIVVALVVTVLSATDAAAQSSNASPSDPRARFVGGNATECAHVGRPGDTQLKGGTTSAQDGLVIGTVTGAGRQQLQVAITDEGRQLGVVIHAVVVKGSDGHNIYENAAVLPPDLPRPQNYISPLNGGGNVPRISHWFVCYTKDPPAPGRLRVIKRLERPVGEPVDPLPTEYRVRARCTLDEEVVARGTFRFGAGGGAGIVEGSDPPAVEMTGIDEGARCRVRELNTDALPEGCDVRYEPPAAGRRGVRKLAEVGLQIVVVNDCQNVPVRRGRVEIVKSVVAPPGVTLPDSFVVNVECAYEDPVQVTVPGSGGPGTPRLDDIRAGADCLVSEETDSLPPGMQVTYAVDGVPSTLPGGASFVVVADATVTVTITNALGTGPRPTPPDLSTESLPTLDMDKTAGRSRVRAGRVVRYTLVVRDRGRGIARPVLVCDRLPRAMTLVSAPGSRFRNGQVCWRIARLRPLASREFTLIARANPRASGGTTNVATADAPRTRERTARVRVGIRPQREEFGPDAVTGVTG